MKLHLVLLVLRWATSALWDVFLNSHLFGPMHHTLEKAQYIKMRSQLSVTWRRLGDLSRVTPLGSGKGKKGNPGCPTPKPGVYLLHDLSFCGSSRSSPSDRLPEEREQSKGRSWFSVSQKEFQKVAQTLLPPQPHSSVPFLINNYSVLPKDGRWSPTPLPAVSGLLI